MNLYVSKKSTKVIWIHLKSFGVIFKSWGDKSNYTNYKHATLTVLFM